MAFERLQQLGQIKFTRILNALMRGEPAMTLARQIRTEWGDFGDVAEKSLTQQLSRLRLAASEGMFGEKVAAEIVKGAIPQIKALEGVTSEVLTRMEEVANLQRQRVLMLVNHERECFTQDKTMVPAQKGKVTFLTSFKKDTTKLVPVPITSTNSVVNDYAQLLQDIQKIRFDLGLDEFKGVIPGMRIAAASSSEIRADGSTTQKQVFEAITTLETIFDRRKVPYLTEMPPL